MDKDLLKALGGIGSFTSQLFSNSSTEPMNDGSPKGLEKGSKSVSESGFGKALGSEAATAAMGLANAAIPKKGVNNATSELGRTAVTAGLDQVAPGLGQLANLAGNAIKTVTRKDDGTYKNTFSAVAENLNPVNLIGNIASGDFSGKKMKRSLEIQKRRDATRKRANQFLANAQSRAETLSRQDDDTFASIYAKRGAKIKKAGCGCNKAKDGIDTDIFKSFDESMMKKLQSFIGTVEDGIYKEIDKNKMKLNAKRKGKQLREYLNEDPSIGSFIIKVETFKKGGSTKSKKDRCYYKIKARYKVFPSAYASGAIAKCRKNS